MNKARSVLFPEICSITTCMSVFGLFSHFAFPYKVISLAGLVSACSIIACRLVRNAYQPIAFLLAFFGIKPLTKKALIYTVICSAGGLLLGAALRVWNKAPLIPGTITLFALGVAPFIGISEELLFRGYIQNSLYAMNGLPAVLLAALSHTIYKSSLMVFSPLFERANIHYFAFWTFAGGFLFGILSMKSDTVYPGLAGHAVFDIIFYSTSKAAPWWVW